MKTTAKRSGPFGMVSRDVHRYLGPRPRLVSSSSRPTWNAARLRSHSKRRKSSPIQWATCWGRFWPPCSYDTVGPALLATLNPDQFQSTLDFNVRFLRPVRPGRVVGKGRVVHRDADIAYIDAALHDSNDATIAVATATAKVIPLAVAKDAV